MPKLHMEILPDAQRKIWSSLGPVTKIGAVLYGGTALALQLGHRISEDYDFFSSRQLDEGMIFEALPWLKDAEMVRVRRDVNTFVYETADDIKITFLGGLPFGRTAEPVFSEENGIWLASCEDIFAEKLKTLFQRVALKDYKDISALLNHGYSLERAVSASRCLYEGMPGINMILQTAAYHDLKELKNLSNADSRTIINACKNFDLKKCVKIPRLSYDFQSRLCLEEDCEDDEGPSLCP